MGELERKNVFVVGAGASKEFDLPTGDDLKKSIASFCSYRRRQDGSGGFSNPRFNNLLQFMVQMREDKNVDPSSLHSRFQEAAISISSNMNIAQSIDNFMDTHSSYEELKILGKLAISEKILEAENSSLLGQNNRTRGANDLRFEATSQTWIGKLFGILSAQRDFDSFIRALENITFVSFNYDRCIEQFFLRASISYFKSPSRPMAGADLHRIRDALEVIHPYGSLGELNFESWDNSGFGIEHTENNFSSLVETSKKIRTFTEGEGDQKVKPAILYALKNCEVLIFLGFAFHPLNMKLLAQDNNRISIGRVLATGLGFSPESQQLIKEELASRFTCDDLDKVSIVGGKCSELFDTHYRFLAGEVHEEEPNLDWADGGLDINWPS